MIVQASREIDRLEEFGTSDKREFSGNSIAGGRVTLSELMQAVDQVAQSGGTIGHCEELAREAQRLADMVGWATRPIDAGGQLLERLAALQDGLDARHASSGEAHVMMLHNAFTDLGQAIARHDEQLNPNYAGGDEGEDFA
ncbi:MAG: hypothetical protein NW217_07980 [Hyphomicrobiaceae bacterium]|nr:hypothetical protein [Hyphomicrobiaceae bacterium]